MSNLGQFGNKNAPWARANTSPNLVNQNNSLQPQIMNQGGLGALGNQGLVQFQQHQQVFQNAIGLQQQNLGLGLQQMANNAMGTASLGSQLASNSIFQQVGAVTYPNSRGLNPTAFQQQNMGNMTSGQGNPNSGIKQRVFTGTVTTVHDNFGFIDDEVFFPRNVCVKGSNPMVGDRVLVEASFNSTTPFKWNASRIQVIPANNQNQSMHQVNSKAFSHSNNYSAVPPPSENNNNNNNNHFGRNRPKASAGGRGRERSRERDRDEDEVERKRRREERMREREKEDKKSPVRRRSRSPKSRRRSRIVPRYMVQIPKIALNLPEGDVLELRRRYTNLYIPSDFFFTQFRWVDAFPPHKPCMLNKPCSFHIINKELDPVVENTAVLEPPDTDYSFSAKVMLMCIPGLEELYQKCCSMAEDKDSDEKDFVHPTRLINFLVGLRGKNETMAIGGPWSPSLDGENPDKDPAVLIRTAIRTCKALTGIDLSHCTQWYRFLELYYRRSDTTHKGKPVPARVETVVLFLPDIWSCLPTRLEWEGLHQIYRKHLEALLKSNADKEADEASATDEKEEEVQTDKVEPTHYSQLDPKTMAVGALRTELKARNVNSKGLKSQLVARLTKALKAEAEKDEEKETEVGEEKSCDSEPAAADVVLEEKKTEVEDKVLGEKEKALLEKRFKLPEQPHIIVHPSKTAKSGKFDCTTMSLSLLLDYRPEDTKEHSFEVSLFAELFNEMLMRDFGFNIFKVLYKMPEKPKEKDEKKKKDDDKKKDKKEDENGKKSEDRKDDKKSEDDSKKDRNDDKKSDKKSDESNDEDDTEEGGSEKKGKKDKEKRKKDRVKMYTKDRHLLLSFVYFDQSHCGYIFDRDIEELIFTLGLDLSRAQVRKLVAKVVVRDSLHYRKLTDKPKDEEIPMEMEEDKTDSGEELALLNKKLLPVFHEVGRPGRRLEGSSTEGVAAVSSDEGLVTFRGGVVDIGKLLSQLERSEKTRLETESRLVEIKSENNKLLEKYNKSHSTIKHLNSEVKEYKDKLRVSDDSLTRITNQSKTFQTLLSDIQSQIEPVLQKASQKEDKDKKHEEKAKEEKSKDDKKYDEKKHEDKKHEQENKSRWEKDGKKSLNDEVKSELKLEINSSEQIVVKKEIDNIT